MVGLYDCFYSSYEYEGNMKVTCGMAVSQFADSFCLLGWTAAAQTDFFLMICFSSFLPTNLIARRIRYTFSSTFINQNS